MSSYQHIKVIEIRQVLFEFSAIYFLPFEVNTDVFCIDRYVVI